MILCDFFVKLIKLKLKVFASSKPHLHCIISDSSWWQKQCLCVQILMDPVQIKQRCPASSPRADVRLITGTILSLNLKQVFHRSYRPKELSHQRRYDFRRSFSWRAFSSRSFSWRSFSLRYFSQISVSWRSFSEKTHCSTEMSRDSQHLRNLT